ncbi:MAG: alpha/beta fold hydrolase [Bryobacteraceae bacterium]|jgi:pimeloyl-ACP methyl ester carboxylesterase
MRRSALLMVSVLGSVMYAAPCVTTAQACTEWITFGGGPARSLIYRTYSLDTRNERITRALIMVHGAGRDADNYFRTAVAAAFLGGALDDTVVISPRLASNAGQACRDMLAPNEVSWSCNSWRSGGPATDNGKVTSFDFTDEILRKLARKDVFPNLRAIVVAGHSAGGQYVKRYEMANQVHYKLGVVITYVVANPSSYAYPDNLRPTDAAYTVSARAPSYVPAAAGATAEAATAVPATGFRPFSDARNCTTYDQWPYGFRNRTGYTEKLSDDELKKELASRPTTYLLGELDVLPLGGFDGSCTAMAQGPTRLARGEAFSKYVNEHLGAHHTVTVIPLCGHNARCMFTADLALPVIFTKQ